VSFTEEWFCQQSQDALGELAALTAPLNGAVVEVGCWEGRSTATLANAVHPSTVLAVDHWQGSPGEISEGLAADRDVYSTFRYNIETLTKGNVVTYKMGWEQFFADHGLPIRFLHIDAEHSYENVKGNLEAALPHMIPGSILCGDDAHHPPVMQAVTEVLGDPGRVATLWFWRLPL